MKHPRTPTGRELVTVPSLHHTHCATRAYGKRDLPCSCGWEGKIVAIEEEALVAYAPRRTR